MAGQAEQKAMQLFNHIEFELSKGVFFFFFHLFTVDDIDIVSVNGKFIVGTNDSLNISTEENVYFFREIFTRRTRDILHSTLAATIFFFFNISSMKFTPLFKNN